jgi:hypothetical protein
VPIQFEDEKALEHSDDLGDIALMLLERDPEITDEQFLRSLREYEGQTREVLAEPAVWRAIEKLSAALQERSRLTDEVREVIRDEPNCRRLNTALDDAEDSKGITDEERWYVLRKLHQATKEMSRSVSRERQLELGAQRTREGLTLRPGPSDDDPLIRRWRRDRW